MASVFGDLFQRDRPGLFREEPVSAVADDEGAAEHQRVHGRVVTAHFGDPFLELFPPLSEGPLLDAEGGEAPLHASEAEVSISRYLQRPGIVVACYGDLIVHPGGVALDADEEGVGRTYALGQADEGEHI